MTPHEILGLAEDATADDARAAFKRLAMQHHPDRGGDAEQFKRLQRALKDFKARLGCPVCENKGYTMERQGMAVKRTQCPRCWGPTRS